MLSQLQANTTNIYKLRIISSQTGVYNTIVSLLPLLQHLFSLTTSLLSYNISSLLHHLFSLTTSLLFYNLSSLFSLITSLISSLYSMQPMHNIKNAKSLSAAYKSTTKRNEMFSGAKTAALPGPGMYSSVTEDTYIICCSG